MNNINYEDDYYGWVAQQAEYVRKSEFDKLDMEHFIEEVLSLGNDEVRVLSSHLEIYLMHLLKVKFQSYLHNRSWDLSIKNSANKYKKTLKKNPSLKPLLKEIIEDSYESARIEAAKETGLQEEIFPVNCPWSIKDIFPEIEEKYT
jgi:uncharacterized protein DUF29